MYYLIVFVVVGLFKTDWTSRISWQDALRNRQIPSACVWCALACWRTPLGSDQTPNASRLRSSGRQQRARASLSPFGLFVIINTLPKRSVPNMRVCAAEADDGKNKDKPPRRGNGSLLKTIAITIMRKLPTANLLIVSKVQTSTFGFSIAASCVNRTSNVPKSQNPTTMSSCRHDPLQTLLCCRHSNQFALNFHSSDLGSCSAREN